ncbi:expressed unknown protein [Seminavis robusta]|uniref:RING-type domain-containing protein n=1 Tax=Seminavis robusta TaxID=568900 RepID=A0A9N8EW26_9STRA|nr:expressed unknown protein [Seminavis robusta]|eukprot:Sro2171_g317450.1 n/a (988) ;mRNA; r:1635-4598
MDPTVEPPKPSSLLVNDLLDAIEERCSRRPDGGVGQYNRQQLGERLEQVLLLTTSPADHHSSEGQNLEWLIRPLIQVILQEQRVDRARTCPPSSDDDEGNGQRPLLQWLVQWKYLRHVYGWQGEDDMVLLLLRLGARADDDASDESSSSLVAAVQYGSVTTIRHLMLETTRQQPKQKHEHKNEMKEWIFSQVILHNLWAKILDRACPEMMQLFLRYIPATERVWMTARYDYAQEDDDDDDDDDSEQLKKKKKKPEEMHVSALDYLLNNLLTWCDDDNNDDENITCDASISTSALSSYWGIVGMPTVERYSQCILQLLQRGVAHTPLTMTLLSYILDQNRHDRNNNQSSSPRHYAFQVAQVLFGNRMPSSPLLSSSMRNWNGTARTNIIINPQESTVEGTSNNPNVCAICLEEPADRPSVMFPWNKNLGDKSTRMMGLYCGHAFCVACLLGWGASEPERLYHHHGNNNNNHNRRTAMMEVSCPICRKPLARDFLNDENRERLATVGYRRRNILGMDPHLGTESRGPQRLSHDQTRQECRARGWSEDDDSEKLKAQWQTVRQQRRNGPKITVDCAASMSLSPTYVAPKHGPVVIPITVKGNIPMLAGISTAAPYTVVSPSAVQWLGLRTTKLTSHRFHELRCRYTTRKRDDDESDTSDDDSDSDDDEVQVSVMKHAVTMAVVDELVVTLAGGTSQSIKVRLRNAVVHDNQINNTQEAWKPSIVLGLDFLESAAWTQTCVEVDVAPSVQDSNRRFMVLLHGGQDIQRVNEADGKGLIEEFRFYAPNGRSFRSPLLHIHPNNHLFFSVRHETSNHHDQHQRRHRSTECEWCCRMFAHVVEDTGRASRRRAKRKRGMIRCQFCCDMAISAKQHVYYCDEECQAKAYQVHRYRHARHRGLLGSLCRMAVAMVMDAIRQQSRMFVVSFIVGLGFSLMISLSERRSIPLIEVWSVLKALARENLSKATFSQLYVHATGANAADELQMQLLTSRPG